MYLCTYVRTVSGSLSALGGREGTDVLGLGGFWWDGRGWRGGMHTEGSPGGVNVEDGMKCGDSVCEVQEQ